MKKYALIVLASVLAASTYAQYPVRDRNKNNQLKSQEFMQWKFTPKWYYYGFWHGGLLGLHQQYINKYGRNIYQTTPMIATVAISESQAEKQDKEVDIVYKQELAKFADREIDIAYELYKSQKDDRVLRIYAALIRYEEGGGDPAVYRPLSDELNRILSNIKIIHESHMSNAKKREAYLSLDGELMQLEGLCKRLSTLLAVAKR